jgi:5'-methylthioadenosine phosphorylase
VTDYDVWHEGQDPVTVEMVMAQLQANARRAEDGVRRLLASLPERRSCACGEALRQAFIGRPGAMPPEARRRLGILVDRYLS